MNQTRSSPNWKKLPGGFDSVNTRWLFPSDNPYQIPTITALALDPLSTVSLSLNQSETENKAKAEGESDSENELDSATNRVSTVALPDWLVPYRTRLRNNEETAKGALHGFLDDYRMESLWTHPTKALGYLAQFGYVITPDFSLYRDWPYAVWLWNVYRSRWLGAFWQSQGLRVIPSVSWASQASFPFAFAGISRGSAVAIATAGIGRDRMAQKLFAEGFNQLLEQSQPSTIVCYGQLERGLIDLAQAQGGEVKCYPTRWEGLRAAQVQALDNMQHKQEPAQKAQRKSYHAVTGQVAGAGAGQPAGARQLELKVKVKAGTS